MVSGWIILDKPTGLGSTQGVAAVKRNLREAGYGKVKTGHGGTLDPLASGVLPIALGEATKLAGRMLDASKVYEFTIAFGIETDTLDAEGQAVETSDVRPSLDEVEAVLARFTGEIEQVPPAFSALKVDGKRAYDLARAGEEVKLKSRQVTVHSLEILPGLDEGHSQVTLSAHVSKGTYIRSLARDIARAVGTVGHVTMLRRTRAGPFALDRAISLDKLNAIGKGARLEPILLPLEAGLDDIPALDLDPEQARAVRQGRVLTGMPQMDGLYWARSGETPVALMELVSGKARVLRGFNLQDVAE
ncbi:MAG: tRNA pseudouridine(55) synthase TruB [Novosphingobium sp.]|nr:tRNA pseudouridine(55) synthase TruB [Novosphingobium sp.]